MRDKIINGEMTDFSDYLVKYDAREAQLNAKIATLSQSGELKPSENFEDHEPKDVSSLAGKAGVADFWTEIILKHPSLDEYVKEEDRPILKHVKSVYVDMAEKPSVVTVKIEFTPNDFFTNSMLEYVLRFEEGDEEQIEGIIGTVIDWKEGQNVTRKRVRKVQR